MLKALVSLSILFAGLPTTPDPPMKMGLWETSLTMTSASGLTGPTLKIRQCITPQNWTTSFQNIQIPECKRVSESFASRGYTADFDCKNHTLHLEISFPTPERGHGEFRASSNAPGSPPLMDSSREMQFVSESCGTVQPSQYVIVH